MERCDFSSVISIIRKYISESREINQTDLLYELFDTFTKSNLGEQLQAAETAESIQGLPRKS